MKVTKLKAWIILFYIVLALPLKATEAPRPNILLILMDDLGYADVGFMPDAASDIHTPNIDALAADGTIFTSAYVSHPFCGPSRTSIMTGRMPHTIGAQYNLAAFSGNGIATTEKFISKVLNEAGYYTGIIGKWHLGEGSEYHPNNRGFDYFYGFLGGGHEYFSNTWLNHSTYNPSNYPVGNYAGDYKRPMMENNTYVATGNGLYCTDVLTDAGVDFINRAALDTEPFFLFMSYNAPHTPVQAMQRDIDGIKSALGADAAQDGSERLTYTAMMYNVDDNIKRLVDKLKATGEFENTLIVFLSDNGGKTTKGALNTPLKGSKGDAYEGGFRVPMFMHWPNGNVPRGFTNANNFSSLDFYPTFAFLAGASIPVDKIYDGIDVWDNVTNKTNPRQDEPIFVMRHHNGFNYSGVVENNYKLFTTGNGSWRLYDLASDISETTDIASQYPQVVTLMKQSAYEWTWRHVEPAFFDAPSYGFEQKWNEFNMPNWPKTFGALYNADDYNAATLIDVAVDNQLAGYIYPNPVQTNVHIKLEHEKANHIDVALYDLQGRLLQFVAGIAPAQNKQYDFAIDAQINNGVYVIKIQTGKSRISKQIVLAR